MKKCPPGVICVENYSMFFLIICIVIIFYLTYSNFKGQNITVNNSPSEKIVMGMVSGDFSSGNFEQAINVVASISEKYDMGGVFVWEYFDCPPDNKDHYKWAENMYNALHIKLLKDCIIL